MIKILRQRMLIIVMVCITLLISFFCIAINGITSYTNAQRAKFYLIRLEEIRQSDSDISSSRLLGTLYDRANIITISTDINGNIISYDSDWKNISEDIDLEYLSKIATEKSSQFGRIDDYYYLTTPDMNGNVVRFLDNKIGFSMENRLLILTISASIFVWGGLWLLAIYIVNRMTEPVTEMLDKQRQFISDAGHELKTPISVIIANIDVLESEIGKNKWLTYIYNESHRMEMLVKDLMILATTEDNGNIGMVSSFNFTEAVYSIALPLESLAFEKGMTIKLPEDKNIPFTGNVEQLKQLISILLSNAIKYGRTGGLIRITLTEEHKKIYLRVYNTGDGIASEDIKHLFDRFYRGDKNRGSGGYGLGLAIAKAIAEQHGGTIRADSVPAEWTEFTVILPVIKTI